REREDEDALGRRRAHRHPRPPETAVEQQLDDQAAEGVADQDRRLRKRLDQRRVVIDDLVEAKTLQRLGALALLLDAGRLPRPLGRGYVEAALREVALELLPASRREPRAVDQHQRNPVSLALGARHVRTSVPIDVGTLPATDEFAARRRSYAV